jgi:prepilin-type N-terminal cleavage/methylation domain-containing protein
MLTSARRTRPLRRGFTIYELLIVVAVVGIMMSIVVPRMRVSPMTEVQLAGMQLAQDMDLARTRALSTRSFARVQFGTSGGVSNYSGYLDTNGDSTITGTSDERLALHGWGTRPMPTHVTVSRGSATGLPTDAGNSAISFANSRVDFDTRGLPTPSGTSGVVYLANSTDPTAVVAVALAPSGSVQIWTWKGGYWQ